MNNFKLTGFHLPYTIKLIQDCILLITQIRLDSVWIFQNTFNSAGNPTHTQMSTTDDRDRLMAKDNWVVTTPLKVIS